MSDKHEAAALSCLKGSSVVSSFFLSFLDAECCLHLFIAFLWSSDGSSMKLISSLKSAQLLVWFWITAVKLTTVSLMSPYCSLTNQLIEAESLKLFDNRLWNKMLWFLFGSCLKNLKWKLKLSMNSYYNFHSSIKLCSQWGQVWRTFLFKKEEKQERKEQGRHLRHNRRRCLFLLICYYMDCFHPYIKVS